MGNKDLRYQEARDFEAFVKIRNRRKPCPKIRARKHALKMRTVKKMYSVLRDINVAEAYLCE